MILIIRCFFISLYRSACLSFTNTKRSVSQITGIDRELVMAFLLLLVVAGLACALRYDPAFEEWNLNTNKEATNPLEYTGTRIGHKYMPSPDNWRFPIYTVMLDRWVNGDPSNDNANGTLFEQDIWSTQLRHGGDVQGLVDSLDYIQGMGIKVNLLLIFRAAWTVS